MNIRQALESARLYAIVDLDYVSPSQAPDRTARLLAGGAGVVQLRAKKYPAAELESLARELLALCRQGGVPFLINDHAELAARIGADGCHVGQDDLPVAEVRALLGPEALVGLSTHSLAQARASLDQRPDYIGFGPLFATPTKPEYEAIGLADIAQVHREVPWPIFCIGGIKPWNLGEVLQAGGQRVVLVSALLQAEDPTALTRQVLAQLPTLA